MQVQMNADDLSLALYGLKSCSYHHPKMNRILSVLRHKAHMIFAKPTQPWADYERMLSTSHAGMLPDVLQQDTSSNPAFSMHSLATALEGVRRLNQSLCREDHHGDEQAQKTLERVQDLQATLLTKLKYTDAPLNLTHLSLFLNAIRYTHFAYCIHVMYIQKNYCSTVNKLDILCCMIMKLCLTLGLLNLYVSLFPPPQIQPHRVLSRPQ